MARSRATVSRLDERKIAREISRPSTRRKPPVKLVVDASVLIAFALTDEAEHENALHFIAACELEKHTIILPTLAWPEVAGNISRRRQDPAKAEIALLRISRFQRLKVVPLSDPFALAAARLAGRHSLRGADAVYVQTARSSRATLVTLDGEMLTRAKEVIPTQTPAEWLHDNGWSVH